MQKLINWVEIPALNFEKAVDFYTKLLNVDLEIFGHENEKMACFPNGEGAISKAPDFNPSKDGVLVSFNPGLALEELLDIVKLNGGQVLQEKTKIEVEGRGYFAIILDCEGNKIALYED